MLKIFFRPFSIMVVEIAAYAWTHSPVVLFGRSMFISKLCAENRSVGAGAGAVRDGGRGGRESASSVGKKTSVV